MSSKAPAETLAAGCDQKRGKLLAAVKTLEDRPPRSDTLIALGEACFRLAVLPDTELSESARYLRMASKYDPFHPKLHYHLGRVLWLNGDFYGSARAYLAALKLAPQSQRAYAHLVLALIELDDAEKEIGRAILDALARGADAELIEQRAALEELLKNREKDDGKQPQSSRRKKKEGAGQKSNGGEVRWQSARLMSLVEQIARPTINPRAAARAFGELMRGDNGPADAAMASLLMLVEPETASMVQGQCDEHHLLDDASPLGAALQKGLDLAIIEDAEVFVQKAAACVLDGSLPLMFVGLLHFQRFGPKSNLKPADAVRLLDRYPPEVKEDPFFTELRMAVLDGFARAAYAAQKYAQAHLLWKAAAAFDPMRVNLAHNLALVATRMNSQEDYQRYWQQAIEMRYLHAAGLEDIEVYIHDRISIHLGFARQSTQRFFDHGKPISGQADRLPTFMADRTAAHTWLEEWDLYYLNTRLQFRSPVHRLGVARDASPEAIEEAQAALKRMLESCLSEKPWSGIKAYCALAAARFDDAASLAADDFERGRDIYYENEKSQAETLLEDLLGRTLTLFNMLRSFLDEVKEGKLLSAADLRLATAVARSFFIFPVGFIKDLYITKGLVKDEDIREIVQSYITNLLISGMDRQGQDGTLQERLTDFESLLSYMTVTPEARFCYIRILAAVKENRKAYDLSVETIAMINRIEKEAAEQEKKAARTEDDHDGENDENKQIKIIKENLINSLDGFALGEMCDADAALLKNSPSNLDEVKRLVVLLKKAHEDFPFAEQITQRLAVELARTGEEGIKEAIALLDAAKDKVLSEESRTAMVKLLGDLRTEEKKAGPRAEATRLIQEAYNSVQALNGTGSTPRTPEEIREILETAIADTERGIRLAQENGETELVKQAEPLLKQLRGVMANFNRRS